MYLSCSVRSTDVFSVDYWRDLKAWVHWSLKMVLLSTFSFLFAFHNNGPILYHFGDKAIYRSKIAMLGKRYYVTLRLPYIVAIPSVCCRLSVMFVQSTHHKL